VWRRCREEAGDRHRVNKFLGRVGKGTEFNRDEKQRGKKVKGLRRTEALWDRPGRWSGLEGGPTFSSMEK